MVQASVPSWGPSTPLPGLKREVFSLTLKKRMFFSSLDTTRKGCLRRTCLPKKCQGASPTPIPHLDRVKRIWYLSPMRAAKVQASLRIRAVSPEPPLLAHRNTESRGTFRQKARSLAPLNDWACAFKICHHGMLEDTNSLYGAHLIFVDIFACA